MAAIDGDSSPTPKPPAKQSDFSSFTESMKTSRKGVRKKGLIYAFIMQTLLISTTESSYHRSYDL